MQVWQLGMREEQEAQTELLMAKLLAQRVQVAEEEHLRQKGMATEQLEQPPELTLKKSPLDYLQERHCAEVQSRQPEKREAQLRQLLLER